MRQTMGTLGNLVEDVEVLAAGLSSTAVGPEVQMADIFEDAKAEGVSVNH